MKRKAEKNKWKVATTKKIQVVDRNDLKREQRECTNIAHIVHRKVHLQRALILIFFSLLTTLLIRFYKVFFLSLEESII